MIYNKIIKKELDNFRQKGDLILTTMEMEISQWEGYERRDFKLDGHECILIVPKKAHPGNPWVWRAEFFGAFDYADRALLEKGWHIAYMMISDMYGCPESVRLMEMFYKYMTEICGLNTRADLFGFSRGGLYSVNYTVKNPQTISTLYLDAPVLNVTSWPGGYGASERYPKEWEECKAVYHLTDETALSFRGNPIDKMEELLKANVKIIMVAGAVDSVVPYQENGAKLATYYQENNGEIQVIVKPDCDHHPHSLKNPDPIVSYIVHNFENLKQ